MARRFSVEAVFRAVDRMSAPVSRMQGRMGRFTRNLERGLRRLDRRAMNVARAFGRHLRRGLLVAGTAATGTFLALNKLADRADDLIKQTRRLEFPIEEFQEWQFVADQAGVGSDTFSKSLDILSKRLGEAGNGQGRLSSMLKRTNPELLEQITSANSMAESYEILMDAISNAETAQERAALTTAAFSNAGLKMSQIARLSAGEIQALRMEQRENGNITQQQAEQAERYNDAMNSLRRSVTGFTQQALFPLMEPLTEGFERMREWTIANREMISGRLLDFFSAIINNFQSIVKWAKRIGIAIGVFFVFMGVLKTFIAIMTAVNLVMALSPLGLMVLGIFALIAAFAALGVWLYTIRSEFVTFWNNISGLFMEKINTIKGWFEEGFLNGMLRIATNIHPFGPIIDGFNWMTEKLFGFPIVDKATEWATGFANGLKAPIRAAFDWVTRQVDRIADLIPDWMKRAAGGARDIAVGSFDTGGGRALGMMDEDDDSQRNAGGPVIVSPEERTVRRLEESRQTESSELLIRDESGRAELTGPRRQGSRIQMVDTGAF